MKMKKNSKPILVQSDFFRKKKRNLFRVFFQKFSKHKKKYFLFLFIGKN